MRAPYLALTLALSMAAGPVHAQVLRGARDKVAVTYDRQRNQRTVLFDRLQFGREVTVGFGMRAREIGLLAAYRTTVTDTSAPDSVELRIVMMKMLMGTGKQPWEFSSDRQLRLFVDDTVPVAVDVANYDMTGTGPNALENLSYRVPRATFEQVIGAQNVVVRVGSQSFTMGPPEIAELRRLARWLPQS